MQGKTRPADATIGIGAFFLDWYAGSGPQLPVSRSALQVLGGGMVGDAIASRRGSVEGVEAS